MKINSVINNVETNGVTETNSFSIKASAHAFQILSSGLYSNKIKAVIRELSCNAVDAHVAAKNKNPIEVKLPNALDTQFYVKDFGTGLTHQQVMKLYTTYFESTKQDSNDFIGGLGVGSKSPFAYTDSFTVESRKDGKKRIYAAYLNEDNTPAISLMSEEDTNEPNGLTVGFPVKPEDFKEFSKEATHVFTSFKQIPTIKGVDFTINPPSLKKLKKLTPSIYTADRDTKFIWKNHVRMGNVIYPLDIKKISEDNPWLGWMLHINGIFIDAPIGTYAVAASREQLQYDPATIKKIQSDMTELFDSWLQEAKQFEQSLVSLKDEYEKKVKIRAWLIDKGLTDGIDEYDFDDDIDENDIFCIKPEDILSSLKKKHNLNIEFVEDRKYVKTTSELKIIEPTIYIAHNIHNDTDYKTRYHVSWPTSSSNKNGYTINYNNNTQLIIIDIPAYRESVSDYLKQQEYLSENNSSNKSKFENFHILSFEKGLTSEEKENALETFKQLTGMSENIIKASSLPRIKSIVAQKKTITKDKIPGNVISKQNPNTKELHIQPEYKYTYLSDDMPIIWIPYNVKTNEYNGLPFNRKYLAQIQESITALGVVEKYLGVEHQIIYGIDPKHTEKLKQFKSVKTFNDYVSELFQGPKIKKLIQNKTARAVVEDNYYLRSALEELGKLLKKETLGKKINSILNIPDIETAIANVCININSLYNMKLGDIEIKETSLDSVWKQLAERYPLVYTEYNASERRTLNSKIQTDLKEYIQWKDNKLQTEFII